jgi:hypothetical protein
MSATNFFHKYRNPYFVETGSYLGAGIMQAKSVGFENIISIELSEKYYNYCKESFKDNPNIKIVLGNSGDCLFDNIKDINAPITFWLDGHYSCGDTARGTLDSPLIQELQQIAKHPIKNHIIMIDDMRSWQGGEFEAQDILRELRNINANYNISYEDGFIKNDVLIAKI